MKIGPKYKIARRLGAPVFAKTQTQKYALSQERKMKNKRMSRPKTDFAAQQLEKQKARYTYGMTEKQFAKYVREAVASKADTVNTLFSTLESRLDNIVYRLGLANSRRFARQVVSHGHITINGRKVTVPSYQVKKGDVIAVREGSKNTKLFADLEEKMKTFTAPAWVSFDIKKMQGSVGGTPVYAIGENMFDLNAVIEFYSR
jgi:small subunit ribosomal protein S4